MAQNRDNQRRSRARNRELMGEMRKQLQEYERRGVEASLEMQRAARNVERENRCLRIMLARRGVLPDEIQAFLQLPDEAADDPVPDDMARRSVTTSSSTRRAPGAETVATLPSTSSPASFSPQLDIRGRTATIELHHGDETPRKLSERARSARHVCKTTSQYTPEQNETTDVLPPVPDCYHPPDSPTTTTPRYPTITPLGTSCIVVAGIIAEVHGHRDAA